MLKLNPLLKEINLFDKKPLIKALADILKSKNVENKEITEYFAKQYIKWFISPKEDSEKQHYTGKHASKLDEPEWAENAFDFKSFSNDHKDELLHTIDFLNQLNDNDLRKIHKIPFDVMRKLVKKWDEKLSKKMGGKAKFITPGKDLKMLQEFPVGYKMVQILSNEARKEEGEMMGHCVGGEDYEKETIYSLRDSAGEPHVTMQLDNDNDIVQIKGKENKAPIAKYVDMIKQFIADNNLEVIYDGENIGMIRWNGRYYDPESPRWNNIYQTKIIPDQNRVFEYIKSHIKNGEISEDIFLGQYYLKQLPNWLKNIKANGNFYCSQNNLTTLEGAPQNVGGHFYCTNNYLTTLEGAPQSVGEGFFCYNNNLTSLKGSPQSVGRDFYCHNNNLTSLEGSPKIVDGSFYCHINNLTTLEGSPKSVVGRFHCSSNNLTSLEGAPESVGGSFSCSGNNLTTLEGAPKTVGGDFQVEYQNSGVKFSEEDVRRVSNVKGRIYT